jgi:simple sugar transport system ATP-binding protein
MSPTAQLEAYQLSKTFGSFKAVDEVSLSFAPGLIHAVLGENGAGKSTLMKLLFGLYQPTSGEIRLGSQRVIWRTPGDAIEHGLGMVQQHFSLVGPLSVIDNIMLGAEVTRNGGLLDREQAIAELSQLLPTGSLALPWQAPVQSLSVGQKQKVEILKLLFRRAQILFLDEPTAVLTPGEIQEFFSILKLLRDSGRTIVLITHKMAEVFKVCDTYAVLRQGRLTASGMIAQANTQSLVEAMVGRKLEPLSEKRNPPPVQNHGQNGNLVKPRLKCQNIKTAALSDASLKNISFEVQAGEILGLAGVEGSGQATLVDCILGLHPFSGDIFLDSHKVKPGSTKHLRQTALGVIPEDRLRQGLWAAETCSENMLIGLDDLFSSGGLLNKKYLSKKTQEWMAQYDVRVPSSQATVGSLSGGNQQKFIFAREVEGHKPQLLICHQPTRGVDLGAIDQIHRTLLNLRDQGIAMLLISSEMDELLALSDRILVFFKGRLNGEFSRPAFDRTQIGTAMTL